MNLHLIKTELYSDEDAGFDFRPRLMSKGGKAQYKA
jgi:hypothetical protein